MLDILWWLLLILYVPACLGLIVIVLLQKGKGSGFAGAFGVGPGSETVFGPRARKSLPVRMTYIAAAAFMLIALVMSMISGRVGKGAAPALAEVAEETTVQSSGLSDLGIATGEAGAADAAATDDAPAAEVESMEAETAESAPAEDAPTAEESTTEESPAATEETPPAEASETEPAPTEAEETPPNTP